MNFETIIGLEVHAQLLTRSKMYCRCSTDYASAPPNTPRRIQTAMYHPTPTNLTTSAHLLPIAPKP